MLRIRTNKEYLGKKTPPISMLKSCAENEKPSLLIVDDDDQVLRVAKRLLANAWCIETASSAFEAAYLLKKLHFDAVLSDFDMPDENGLWVLQTARKYHPFIRRVLFSGSGPNDISAHVHSGLVHCFVAKPSGREELAASLRWKVTTVCN